MEESGNDLQIEQLDVLLDELEQLAHSDIPRAKYYFTVLERLRFVLNAEGVAFAVRIDGRQWGAVVSCGKIDAPSILAGWVEGFPSPSTSPDSTVLDPQDQKTSAAADSYNPLEYWMVRTIGLDPAAPQGAVLVQFSSEMPTAAVKAISPLLQAFGDLIRLRQTSELERFVFQRWPSLQRVLAAVAKSKSIEEAETLLVNDLRPLLCADRISLVRSQTHAPPQLVTVSGAINFERNSETASSIEQIGKSVIESGMPIVHHWRPNGHLPTQADETLPGLLPNMIAFPVGKTKNASDHRCHCALLFEWNEYDDLLQNMLAVNSLIPVIDWVWSVILRSPNDSIAAKILSFGRRKTSLPQSSGSMLRSGIVPVAAIGLILLLFIPVPLRITMSGSLEPESQRIVYAAMDGVVEKVWVGDNASVHRGQRLVTMRSPNLELQIQEVVGELNANLEKRDALSLSLNQLTQQNAANASVLNRVSSEIRQLETVAEMLQAKLRSLQDEQSRLTLTAPMDGIVIARDLDQLLDSRPLRRGDALFRVVDPTGQWRLHLSISDTDMGYVQNQFSQVHQSEQDPPESGSQSQVDFVIISKPEKKFTANLTWLSDSARNSDGTGVFIDAMAEIDPLAAEHAYIGATVEAFLNCGRRSLWFVCSRPLVEAIQRRFWF